MFNPTWEPPGIPAPLVNETMRRLQAAIQRRSEPDLGILALEAAGAVFSQPQNVGPALLAWANRTALLAVGEAMCLDLVSRPDAFARLWPKLRAGYLLDALEHLDARPASSDSIDAFVGAIDEAERTTQPSAGLGHDLRLRGAEVIGSGLEVEGEVVQLSAFSSGDGGRRAFGR